MRKITSISLILFISIFGFLYLYSFVFPNSGTYIPKIFNQPIITNSTTTTTIANNTINPVFTKNELSKHSTPNDCYLAINNKVYDVSSYIGYHPGGVKQITSRCGREVTGIFASIHSNRAWDLLAKYKIGTFSGSPVNNAVNFDLNAIKDGFKKANPDVEVISVKPKNNYYIAKVIYNKKLYEVHIDFHGNIIKEEVESDEFNWSLWNSDKDDN